MLALDDSRWSELSHRGGSAADVPGRLAALLERGGDLAAFQDLWPYLCSEGTAWSAAYAAVPYIVELASRLSPAERFEYIFVVGLVAMCFCPDCGEAFEIKPYLAKAYHEALGKALPLLAETLVCQHDATETRYLLAAAAALKGHAKLGEVIYDLYCVVSCPECGAEVVALDA